MGGAAEEAYGALRAVQRRRARGGRRRSAEPPRKEEETKRIREGRGRNKKVEKMNEKEK
jgi:hypothetical protein